MADSERPGALYWIDHYVVPSNDTQRWGDFERKIIGARDMNRGFPAGQPQFIRFQEITSCCHHGAMLAPEPLEPSLGLGKGLPRHGLYIRQQHIDQHLRRLDENKVPHLDPVRTSVDGEDGISILWEDPDGNQFEFWAPDRVPEGAMPEATSLGVGRISHGVYESRDLQRTANHFATYCGTEPAAGDMTSDTLVLRLLGGARIIYKKVDTIHRRTAGWGKLQAAHAALVMRDEDFWPSYEKMWASVPEWEWNRATGEFVGAGPELPARTARHGSPAGRQWYDIRGRGDDWYDWDTNCFHFMGGAPKARSFAEYEGHTMDWHLPRFLEQQSLASS
jgi:hypothetical protein